MRLDVYSLVSLTVEILLLMFHVSVFAVVATLFARKTYPFTGAFYKLYIVQSVFDWLTYMPETFLIRLNFCGLLPQSYNVSNSLSGRIAYFSGAYLVSFEYLCSFVLALNRASAVLTPLEHKNKWNNDRTNKIILVVMALPIFLAAVQLFAQFEPIPVDVGYILVDVNPATSMISGLSHIAVCLATSLASAILDFRTLRAYRRLSLAVKRERKEEYRLLVYAIVQLFGHILTLAFHLTFSVLAATPLVVISMVFSHVIDLLCLSRPICLLLNSPTARRAYLQFYRLRKEHVPTSSAQISVVLPSDPTATQ